MKRILQPVQVSARIYTVMLMMALAVLFVLIPGESVWAQQGADLADACTTQNFFDPDQNTGFGERLENLLQDIVGLIDTSLSNVAHQLFRGIVTSSGYSTIILASLTLYLIFYAVGFMFGIVQATFAEALMRVIKIGIIFSLMYPFSFTGFACWLLPHNPLNLFGFCSFGWTLFNDVVGGIFERGTNYLINLMISIGAGCDVYANIPWLGVSCIDLGGGPITSLSANIAQPFGLFDGILQLVISPKYFAILQAAFGTGPFGIVMALALGMSLMLLVMVMIRALLVYCMFLLVKTLLFGLAPIFIGFILFERTKHIFIGWINQLANVSLQAILMFGFLAFFAVMIQTAAEDMLTGVDVCYTKTEKLANGPEDVNVWRFMVNGQPYEGNWGLDGPVGVDSASVFPMSILKVLIFAILCYIAFKMTDVITSLANELTHSIMRLDRLPGALNDGVRNFTSFGRGGGSGGGGLISDPERLRKLGSSSRK